MIILRMMPGGLASQMSQFAFLEKFNQLGRLTGFDLQDFKRSDYSLFNGLELKSVFGLEEHEAPLSEINHLGENSKAFLQKVRRKLIGPKKSYLAEKLFTFYADVYDLKDAYLYGYFGYNRYYHDIRPHLLNMFQFPKLDERNEKLIQSLSMKESVSIHVRRGDYLKVPIFQGCVGAEYYKNSIQMMRDQIKNPHFVVFSDDLPWCREHLGLGDFATYVDWNQGKESYRDMQLMSLCHHNIIANSGFSYWGAYLGSERGRIVSCPTKWYNDDRFQLDLAVPKEWLRT